MILEFEDSKLEYMYYTSLFVHVIQEDEDLLQKGKLSDTVRLCVQLRRCEKKILDSVKDFSASRIQKLHPQS